VSKVAIGLVLSPREASKRTVRDLRLSGEGFQFCGTQSAHKTLRDAPRTLSERKILLPSCISSPRYEVFVDDLNCLVSSVSLQALCGRCFSASVKTTVISATGALWRGLSTRRNQCATHASPRALGGRWEKVVEET